MSYYSRDEQETHYSFSPVDGYYRIESTYPPDIRRIMERCEVVATVTDDRGRVILVTARADREQMRIYNRTPKTGGSPA
ncbi:hypothetical protein M3557_04340 [Bhargavaea ginsengi]|uniref:hypothetical protein n=1 Tax=Bhargavaea ginsengi TaxID=426757 RepID=UPI00203C1387|nr:hypothetical protein [Bhargavaea ginsengi]MCM3087137.1 hypothetical protein [Bhargavaea ginsengi]